MSAISNINARRARRRDQFNAYVGRCIYHAYLLHRYSLICKAGIDVNRPETATAVKKKEQILIAISAKVKFDQQGRVDVVQQTLNV